MVAMGAFRSRLSALQGDHAGTADYAFISLLCFSVSDAPGLVSLRLRRKRWSNSQPKGNQQCEQFPHAFHCSGWTRAQNISFNPN